MFRIRQYIKMLLQNVLLPLVYGLFCRRPLRKGSVIFADAHHEEMPFSMQRMYEAVVKTGREPELYIRDFQKMSFLKLAGYLLRFMKQYATAEYVFICDYFLPVAACQKRQETTVVQLWHSCGLMKKIAYDTAQDIPGNYRGNMFGNYTWLTLSAEICVPVHARALRLPRERIRAVGVSRTDCYFDPVWIEKCRRRFFDQYPQAAGKKIALWAPTFRGNAAMPSLEGLSDIREAWRELEEEFFLIIKAHPHVDAREPVSNCGILTEELLPVADVLITDYSSVLFDYLIFEKPAVLFAPDLEEYEAKRGFYLDYRSIPFPLAKNRETLARAVRSCGQWEKEEREKLKAFRLLYTGACDGRATERILALAGLDSCRDTGG